MSVPNIYYFKGSLFTAPVQAILHCANCFNTMNSGIAKVIRETYPEAYEADCKTTSGDENKLGLATMAHIKNPKDPIRRIYNCYGQYSYGLGERHLNYEAIYNSLERVRKSLAVTNRDVLGIPFRMGCDRAGGDWRLVEVMIESVFEKYQPGVLICQRPEDDNGYIRRFSFKHFN